MIVYVSLALLNGMFIGTSRAVNGRLGTEVGPLQASLWNHVMGFLFLTLVLFMVGGWGLEVGPAPPPSAYLGGLFGALFVAVNSYVFSRLGSMSAILLVISGQMISAVLMEFRNQEGATPVAPAVVRGLGVVLVLLGVYLTRVASSSRDKDKAQ